ncbi:MAG: HNH endonuclease family protein, partial [Candidatus Nanopelagicales bacterium]
LSRLRGPGNTRADGYRIKWQEFRTSLEASGSDRRIDANQFIHHWWLSRADYVAQRKLFRSIKTSVKSVTNAEGMLDELSADATHYRTAIQPGSVNWPIEVRQARDSLMALSEFGVSQPAPLLLALVRARASTPKLGANQLNTTLEVIERFHFQSTIVAQLSSSGGVSSMYAKAARDLYAAGADPQARANVLAEIRSKLIERSPDKEQFIAAFKDRFIFTSVLTRDKALVQYVLKRLLKATHPTTSLDNLTIEHILPEQSGDAADAASPIGSIGNLLMVDTELNGLLGHKDFTLKRAILEEHGLGYVTDGILDQSEWTEVQIAARARAMSERAYDSVWNLPL